MEKDETSSESDLSGEEEKKEEKFPTQSLKSQNLYVNIGILYFFQNY